MKVAALEQMKRGWFIGDFEPSLLRTKDVEVAVKYYKAGDTEAAHHHKIATEFTVVVSGEIQMNGESYGQGTILVVNPSETVLFKALTDSITTVVKIPAAPNDKYLD